MSVGQSGRSKDPVDSSWRSRPGAAAIHASRDVRRGEAWNTGIIRIGGARRADERRLPFFPRLNRLHRREDLSDHATGRDL